MKLPGEEERFINGYLILEKLKKINKVSYLYAANHQADIKINYNVLSIKEKDIYKLSELDAGAENKFYDYIIGYLSRKAEEDPRYYNYHKVFPIGLFNPQSLLLNKIINSFFISKRADIRSSKIIERLKDDGYKQPGFDRIREIMKKLYNLSQLPEYQANSRVDHIENALRDFIYLPAKKSR